MSNRDNSQPTREGFAAPMVVREFPGLKDGLDGADDRHRRRDAKRKPNAPIRVFLLVSFKARLKRVPRRLSFHFAAFFV